MENASKSVGLPLAWLEGRVMPASEARLPVTDLGVQHGLSLFETVRVTRGRALRLTAHLARLLEGEGPRRLEIDLPADAATRFREGVLALERAWGPADGALRLVLTSGDPPTLPPCLYATLTPPRPLPDGARERGVSVITLGAEAGLSLGGGGAPTAGIKTASYADRVLLRRRARAKGAHDALLVTPHGLLAEGTATSVFLVRQGRLHTPALSLGILPGVLRAATLSAATRLGLPAAEAPLAPADLAFADEAFLTSALAGILPVREVDGHRLPGAPGPLTRRLAEALRAEEDGEVAAGLGA